jgi:hypothetical protein
MSTIVHIELSLGDCNAALLQDGERQLLLHQLRQYLHFCTSKASDLSTCSASAHQCFYFFIWRLERGAAARWRAPSASMRVSVFVLLH